MITQIKTLEARQAQIADRKFELFALLKGNYNDAYYDELESLDKEYFELRDQIARLESQPKKMGRPQLGHTRKVSLTLTADQWAFLEAVQYDQEYSLSETVRYIINTSMEATEQLAEEVHGR